MQVIISLIVILFFCFLLHRLARKLKIPPVAFLIIAGVFFAFPYPQSLFIHEHEIVLAFLGNAGLICLMFLAGLESSWKVLLQEEKDGFAIAFFATLFPLGFGMFLFLLLGFSTITSFIMGLCMSITAEATKAQVLMDFGKLKTKVGAAMMDAGIIDDLIGLSFFMLLTFFTKEVFLKHDFLIIGAILAFLLGVIIPTELLARHKFLKYTDRFLIWTIIPFFFVSIGLAFDFSSIFVDPLLLLFIIVIAIVGKLIGTFLAKPYTSFSWKQLHIIGWSMNSRGAVELALAFVALQSGFLNRELYSSLVIMALLTTLLFPFIFSFLLKRHKGIME